MVGGHNIIISVIACTTTRYIRYFTTSHIITLSYAIIRLIVVGLLGGEFKCPASLPSPCPFVLFPLSTPYHSTTPRHLHFLHLYRRPFICIPGIKGPVFVPLITIVCYRVIIPRTECHQCHLPSRYPFWSLSLSLSRPIPTSAATVVNRPPDNEPYPRYNL